MLKQYHLVTLIQCHYCWHWLLAWPLYMFISFSQWCQIMCICPDRSAVNMWSPQMFASRFSQHAAMSQTRSFQDRSPVVLTSRNIVLERRFTHRKKEMFLANLTETKAQNRILVLLLSHKDTAQKHIKQECYLS